MIFSVILINMGPYRTPCRFLKDNEMENEFTDINILQTVSMVFGKVILEVNVILVNKSRHDLYKIGSVLSDELLEVTFICRHSVLMPWSHFGAPPHDGGTRPG